MKLITEEYQVQAALWPPYGRHILAQYDESAIIVYQAYRSSSGRFAVSHGYSAWSNKPFPIKIS